MTERREDVLKAMVQDADISEVSRAALVHTLQEIYDQCIGDNRRYAEKDFAPACSLALKLFSRLMDETLAAHHKKMKALDFVTNGLIHPVDTISDVAKEKCSLEVDAKHAIGDSLFAAVYVALLARQPYAQREASIEAVKHILKKHGFEFNKGLGIALGNNKHVVESFLWDLDLDSEVLSTALCVDMVWEQNALSSQVSTTQAIAYQVPVVLDVDDVFDAVWLRKLPKSQRFSASQHMEAELIEIIRKSDAAGFTTIVEALPTMHYSIFPALKDCKRVLYLVGAAACRSGSGSKVPNWFDPGLGHVLMHLSLADAPRAQCTAVQLTNVLSLVKPTLVTEISQLRFAIAENIESLDELHSKILLAPSKEELEALQKRRKSLVEMNKVMESRLLKRLVEGEQWLPLADLTLDLWAVQRSIDRTNDPTRTLTLGSSMKAFFEQCMKPAIASKLSRSRHHVVGAIDKDTARRHGFYARKFGEGYRRFPEGKQDLSDAEEQLLVSICEAVVGAFLTSEGNPLTVLAHGQRCGAAGEIAPALSYFMASIATTLVDGDGKKIVNVPSSDDLMEVTNRQLMLLRALTSIISGGSDDDYDKEDFYSDWCKRCEETKARLTSLDQDTCRVQARWAIADMEGASIHTDATMDAVAQYSPCDNLTAGWNELLMALKQSAVRKLTFEQRRHSALAKETKVLNAKALELYLKLSETSNPNAILESSSQVKGIETEAARLRKIANSIGLAKSGVDDAVIQLLVEFTRG